MSETPQTVGDVLRLAAAHLEKSGVEEGRLAAEHLLARLLRVPRLELTLHATDPMGERLLDAMRRGVRRVAAGEPVQYVIGETDFRGHRMRVDVRALIPRPETEGLVQLLLDCADLWASGEPRILDFGTGTGCIALAIALERPTAHVLGVDASPEAAECALENAAHLGLQDRVPVLCGDLADHLEAATLDAVISNPPYIATRDWERLSRHIREHEPRMALDGGGDGLDVIRQVMEDASMLLRPGGWLFLEMGYDQAAAATELAGEAGFESVEVHRDLSGRDRYLVARMPA